MQSSEEVYLHVLGVKVFVERIWICSATAPLQTVVLLEGGIILSGCTFANTSISRLPFVIDGC